MGEAGIGLPVQCCTECNTVKRIGLPDGPGFSLCATLLESSSPVSQSGTVRTAVGGTEVQSIPDQRETEKLGEQGESKLSRKLSQYLVNIQTDSTRHWWLTFITTGSSAGS